MMNGDFLTFIIQSPGTNSSKVWLNILKDGMSFQGALLTGTDSHYSKNLDLEADGEYSFKLSVEDWLGNKKEVPAVPSLKEVKSPTKDSAITIEGMLQ